jgi:esterase/lipase superfamily enzyme
MTAALEFAQNKFAMYYDIFVTFGSKMVVFPSRNTNIYKIYELRNISSCLDQNLVYSWNHPLFTPISLSRAG